MDTKKLKQKILDLAVRGKLVPQDPSDEPASVLLERIRTEKEQLIKEKKIKRDKNESHIYRSGKSYYEKRGSEAVCIDDEIPFEIPASWEWCRLREVAAYKKGPFGSSITKSMFVAKSNDTIKVYEQKNAIKKDATLGSYYISNEKFNELKGFELLPNDIIVSCAGTIGETYVMPEKMEQGIINQALMYIRLFDNNLRDFYLIYFESILKQEAISKGKGTAIKNIPPFDVLKDFLIPIPPIPEQNRIILEVNNILDKVINIDENIDDVKSAIKQAKAKVLDLAIRGKLVPQDPTDEPASVLLERIKAENESTTKSSKRSAKTASTTSDNSHYPYEIPESWIWCCFGDTNDYGKCQSVKPTDIELDDWILDLEDIEKNTGKVIAYNTYQTRSSASNKYKFSKGQLLYSKLRPYLNKVTIAQFDGYCTSEIIPINFKGYVAPRYGQIFLMSNYFLEYANMLSYGMKMPRMGTNDAKKARFPLPPLNEQKRIGTKVDEIFEQFDSIEKALME